jgi:hypothetical protein
MKEQRRMAWRRRHRWAIRLATISLFSFIAVTSDVAVAHDVKGGAAFDTVGQVPADSPAPADATDPAYWAELGFGPEAAARLAHQVQEGLGPAAGWGDPVDPSQAPSAAGLGSPVNPANPANPPGMPKRWVPHGAGVPF